jgi:hypothetical protein
MQTVNRRTISLAPLALTLVLGACATVSPTREAIAPDLYATEFGQPSRTNLVGLADLVRTREENLFDALIAARPTRMRNRLPLTTGPDTEHVAVYLNEQYLGGPNELRAFRTREVTSVRFLSKVETALKFGRSPVDGSIVITTR